MARSTRKIFSFRARVAGGFLLAAIVVSSVVGGATYALAASYLTNQRTDSLIRQSFNTIRFAQELVRGPEPPNAEGMVTGLKARVTGDILVRASGTSFASSISITYETLPRELTDVVGKQGVGYAEFNNPPHLAFGSPVPGSSFEIYFVYSLSELRATLSTLSRIILVVSLSAAILAGVLGLRVSTAVIRPLRSASQAAERVAAGLIDTRLDASSDELGQLASSFNQMAEALQERIARERRFVADASHELRTPLTALGASVEYLAERADRLPSELSSTANLALEQVRSLRELVDDLLELSKIEAGTLQLNIENLDMLQFLSEVARRRSGDQNIEIASHPPNLNIAADKIRLERIVGNLVENAVTHGMARQVEVSAVARGGSAVISVSDRGPGLRPQDIAHIFEPFWMGDSSRHRGSARGSGLGLAIARENARLIGAELDVFSRAGETRFTVHLKNSAVVAEDLTS